MTDDASIPSGPEALSIAGTEPGGDGHQAGASAPSSAGEATAARGGPVRPRRRVPWALILAVVFVAELGIFGARGELSVCVGKGDVDFALAPEAVTDANRRWLPTCERRLNLGMRSEYEALIEDARAQACRRATLLHHRGEARSCEARTDGWQERVTSVFVPPWDPRVRQQMFWYLY